MGMRRKCRVWWPKHLSLSEPSSSSLLFGWCISCSSVSLDVVVAFSCNEGLLSNCRSGLQGILQNVNQKMPVFLQDKSTFSLLGQCDAGFRDNGPKLEVVKGDNGRQLSTSGNALSRDRKEICRESNTRSCGCNKINGFLEKYKHASDGFSNWIQFVYHPREKYCRDIHWIPELHHIHWNQQIVPQCDVHVVIYETPTYGVHHFSLGLRGSFQLVKVPLKKPKWVDELHQKQPLIDLDTAILAINSATAATVNFQRHVGSRRSFLQLSAVYKCLIFICQILAIFLASLSSLFYVSLQFIHSSFSYASQSWLCITSLKMFRTTSINIQIRSRQILYWPVFLTENSFRSLSCVEYAEKAALHKHSVWSSLVVDILLGNLFGLALLYYTESDCSWVLNLANNITNNLLRSGCVWLMGVPAGFKLNTELAGVLGMISLNAIQIWSTLWIFAGFLFIYFIKGIAILGILFGMTVPAALIVDMITFATLHVSTLHWLISLLYSVQIQALAALWRLFRGRKWNPLRQRLDSYDYTVKQHVVGSLLFTLLLLLLPTTSVFYIFFTIMSSAISFICSLIESAISIIHATPYIKIFLWLVRRRRFPSGIWFEILSCRGAIDSSEVVCRDGGSVRESSSQNQKNSKKPTVLVSFLHSNFLSLGQTVSPHYRNVFCGVSGSFVATSAYGVLTGRRMACTLETGLPSKMPWMSIPCKEYWRLCYDAVLACCSSRQ